MSEPITNGQDSFLDIVANLVGVLIILVVVIGAQATTVWQKAEPNDDLIQQVSHLESELDKNSLVVAKLEIDNEQLEQKIVKESQLTAGLAEQRHDMLMQLEIVKREIAKEKLARRKKRHERQSKVDAKLSENLEKQAEFESQKRSLLLELGQLKRESSAVKAAVEPKSEVIKHFPSPIAQTVFSDEVHFQLSAGKIAFVPMDELLSKMKSEWKVKAEKLKQTYRTVETVGPIAGFRMQYELVSEDWKQKTRYGLVDQKRVRFKQFQLFPVSSQMGESVSQALQNGSRFQSVLSRYEPRKTTISIWVYPDSYSEHGEVKNWAYENGFQMASWPLDRGKRISGGPDGFKTSAQ